MIPEIPDSGRQEELNTTRENVHDGTLEALNYTRRSILTLACDMYKKTDIETKDLTPEELLELIKAMREKMFAIYALKDINNRAESKKRADHSQELLSNLSERDRHNSEMGKNKC